MKYIKRISDEKIRRYLGIFGAVLVEGPKWCGKTRSSEEQAASVFKVADPKNNFHNRTIAQIDPEQALAGEAPRLIDEWQEVPALWDAIRHIVDESGKRGNYILTGSSTPNDAATIHSGVGRFGRVKMSTMTLQELGVSKGVISLKDLLYGKVKLEHNYSGRLTLDDITNLICKGGWPELVDDDVGTAMESMANYIQTLAEEDLSKIDNTKRDPVKILALLQSVSRNTASLVSKETIRKDIEQYSGMGLTSITVDEYLNLLKRVFVLSEIPAWDSALKSTVRLRTAPKRVLVDPSLAAAALNASPVALKQDLKLTGNLFETLVLHDLAVYADANRAKLYHYNDNADLEIDAVVEGRDQNWGAIEIKLGYINEDTAAASLLRLVGKLEETKQKPPRFLAVITGIGSILRKRDDGVWVIPVDALGA